MAKGLFLGRDLPSLPAAPPPPSHPSGPSSSSPGQGAGAWESGSHGLGALGPEPSLALSCSFTLSLLDEAAHVLVTLRASFTDRTLAWVSSWGRKKLISAPFLFYPQRFFEVGQSQGFPSWGQGS